MSVKGFWALRLDDYVRGADPGAITAMTNGWGDGRRAFNSAGRTMSNNATKASDGFSETMMSGAAMKNTLVDSSKFAHEKRDKILDAEDALSAVQLRIKEAMIAKAEIDSSLPGSHPAVNPADFPTDAKQVGKRRAEKNESALAQAKADHAEREAAIADAERKAAAKVQAVDAAVIDADPKVRALIDPDNTRQERPSGTPTSIPGSYSAVAAAQARKAKISSNALYPDGWGYEKIEAENEAIKQHQAENIPEWDNEKGQWISADGSPAPATSYAMVETSEGLAPLGGGPGGATALALGAGGALLGAGVAKAIATKFGAGAAAKAGAPGVAARSTAARTGAAGVRAGAGAGAGARNAGARGAGARGAGAAGGRGSGAGGRAAGRGGAGGRAGAGATGRRGAKKRDENGSQNQEWAADYTDDWTENASDVLDPRASRGWVPDSSEDGGNEKRS
ncbi:hypothetical protein J2S40_004186 [Nocardioides luteus]|uniref:PPE family domain-containing protein n=1 Tax=Nocardioides luteus TaxID=1844 RepID=A0ABQ5SR00_9ACTN|nr:hypothetical protein [Nocardioides luteus]MDR7313128.1 hypothetical protein [Nocardioides luteus]GGR43911.1 hypothetical protein GCM10010197_06700 [Nocardioides luteus]GLJ66191.1 hypothetical protein GCM10017579_02270 [Nocardioides luteus]